MSVTWRFWIKGCHLDPPVSDVTFLDQRRSVESRCQWRDVFGSKKDEFSQNVSTPKYTLPTESWPDDPILGLGLWPSLNKILRRGVKKRIFYGQADRKRLTPPPLTVSFFWFFWCVFYLLFCFYVFWNGFYTRKSQFSCSFLKRMRKKWITWQGILDVVYLGVLYQVPYNNALVFINIPKTHPWWCFFF